MPCHQEAPSDVGSRRPAAEQRGEQILAVFDTAFGELLAADPAAFRVKFRKMAASAFAFYRGTACLFYADLEREQHGGPYLDDRTGRVWIHGDLHAENFGTYMDAQGRLIFNVNDFDEAYVGPFTWDLKRFAASVALIGYTKALSDEQITELVRIYAAAYRERIHALATGAKNDEVPPFTLDTAEGPLLDALRDARALTRFAPARLDDGDPRLRAPLRLRRRLHRAGRGHPVQGPRRLRRLSGDAAGVVADPPRLVPREGRRRPPGHRHRLGGPALVQHPSGGQQRRPGERRRDLPQAGADPGRLPAHHGRASIRDYFQHEGHRTVISQRALQAHADPWLGWTELDGSGQLVAEVSPYAVDLDWSDIDDPEEIAAVVADLGRATADHARGGGRRERPLGLVPFSTERAIDAAIAADEDGFAGLLVDFAHEYGARARAGPPDLRRPLPQRPDPGPVGRVCEPGLRAAHRDP